MRSISATRPDVAGQRGASLITAVFLITALAVLAALMTRLMVFSSGETINEWYSAQALYAAESGVDWAAHSIINGGGGTATDVTVNADGTAWFTTEVEQLAVGDSTLYTITSTGTAGSSAANPAAQRRLVVQFMP